MEIKLKQTEAQIKWIDTMIDRYLFATGRKLTRQDVLMRVLFHGVSGAENEMKALEALEGKKDANETIINGRKYGHLTILD